MFKSPRTVVRRRVSTPVIVMEQLEHRVVLSAVPLAPTVATATGASATSINLTWNAPADPSITGYDVYEKVHHVIHQPKGSSRSYDTYDLRASNLATTSDTLTGLISGSYHTYLVTSVNAAGQSIFSPAATGETWVAPTFSNGPTYYLLSSGAVWSGPAPATVGLTTQVSLLVGGNPLTFAKVSGPSKMSIDSHGVISYTAAAKEVGTQTGVFAISNSLGTITQTVQFAVTAAPTTAPKPTLKLVATSGTYTGSYQQVAATALAADGVTPVAGYFTYTYGGGKGGYPLAVGTTSVLATFTSSDPKYSNATLVANYTIKQAAPSFSALSPATIAVGTASTTLTGSLTAGSAIPKNDYVIATLNGVSVDAVVDTFGNFKAVFDTSALPVGSYKVGYAFAGDANFKAAAAASTTLSVIPTAAPVITTQPKNVITTEGDGASFIAIATGSPPPTVQWQVSTDGGTTWANVTSNASAQTTTLTFSLTSLAQNGSKYRAVFTNLVGTVISSIVTLTVEANN